MAEGAAGTGPTSGPDSAARAGEDSLEEQVVRAISLERIAEDTSALVRVASLTGGERACLERLVEIAASHGLEAELEEYDLDELRSLPGYPGSTARRDSLFGARITVGSSSARRLCFNGHVDVVSPGSAAWSFDPWSGDATGGDVLGRGSVDMKGAVVAALHALAAIGRIGHDPGCELVLQAVSSEEDGGQGTFAALARDARFNACVIPEPTSFRVVCAQAGSLGFKGFVRGRSAHAAIRRSGVSAIDRYVAMHRAMSELETTRNSGVEHPLMRELDLPYPISVGRLEAGDWFAQVPDWARFEGRFGVRIGERLDTARSEFEAALKNAIDDRDAVEVDWSGAEFAPGETDPKHPLARLVQDAGQVELGARPELAGVPYGADMRLYCARGIPCVMFGTPGLELAHAPDERVSVADLAVVSRTLARVAMWFGAAPL